MGKYTHQLDDVDDNEEDRLNGLLEAKRRYSNQSYLCVPCNITIQEEAKPITIILKDINVI